MSECGMPLILLGALEAWLKRHPEVVERFKGQKPTLADLIDALVETEQGKS